MKEKDLYYISSLILLTFLVIFNLTNIILYLSNIPLVSKFNEYDSFSFTLNTISFSFKLTSSILFLIFTCIFIYFFVKDHKKEVVFYNLNALTLALNFDIFLGILFFMIDKNHTTNNVSTSTIISLVFIGLSFILIGLNFIRNMKKKVSLYLTLTSLILVLFSYCLVVIKDLEASQINYIFVTKIVLLIFSILIYSIYLISFLAIDPVYEISINRYEKYLDRRKGIETSLKDLKEKFDRGELKDREYFEEKEKLEKRL